MSNKPSAWYDYENRRKLERIAVKDKTLVYKEVMQDSVSEVGTLMDVNKRATEMYSELLSTSKYASKTESVDALLQHGSIQYLLSCIVYSIARMPNRDMEFTAFAGMVTVGAFADYDRYDSQQGVYMKGMCHLLAVWGDLGLYTLSKHYNEDDEVVWTLESQLTITEDLERRLYNSTRKLPSLIPTMTSSDMYTENPSRYILKGGCSLPPKSEKVNLYAIKVQSTTVFTLDKHMVDTVQYFNPDKILSDGTRAGDDPDAEDTFNRLNTDTTVIKHWLMACGNEFYFNFRVDRRSRLYSQGHQISTQGDEYRKAMINLRGLSIIDVPTEYQLEK